MFALLGSILVIHLFALMSPGPDFAFVTRTAVVESRARALLGVAGIVAGQIVWSGLSLLGLDILFQQFAGLQKIIAFAGGCYLLWMAFGILRSVWRMRAAKSSTVSADAPARADDEGGVKHRSRIPFKSTRAVQPGIRGNYSLSHQVSLAPDGITSQGRFTKRRLAS